MHFLSILWTFFQIWDSKSLWTGLIYRVIWRDDSKINEKMYVRIGLSNFITSFSFSTVESYNRHLLKQTSKQTWVKVTLVKINMCSVSQSCPAFCNPLDWRPPGSSVHRIFLSKNAGVGCHFFLQRWCRTSDGDGLCFPWENSPKVSLLMVIMTRIRGKDSGEAEWKAEPGGWVRATKRSGSLHTCFTTN